MASIPIEPGVDLGRTQGPLPRELDRLFPRMREIAAIVYANGSATVKDVQATITDDLEVYGIRTLMNRLAQKGVLKRRKSGRHSEILYLPAILNDNVREAALERLVDQYFSGSRAEALQSTLRLISRDDG